MTNKDYSLYGLLDKYYEAKRTYYRTGKCSITDQEYDALEASIKTIHGENTTIEFGTVGYDSEKHDKIKQLFKQQKELFRSTFNGNNND